ncbi:Clavaminate synthase-like protein [Saitoella complicata NRRL Y-17804]|uniref:Clavaminate synthase-like protein n=1 Tax=Saitoella complicata (strain BCRC 22490 / CBS 7301 / JCM 7358 / NBRC 10748 / NRRL Y-17804) TaxID=698492 RepID=UPI00086799D8|nr:Clavaminate synthase-like protein [Saitoella complicata NRRL Y-17804]ODQ50425.1 Clavaminate synthase-like protein [Saitoella complicata NRRL Y-17804]
MPDQTSARPDKPVKREEETWDHCAACTTDTAPKDPDAPWIQCSPCHSWFHVQCVDLKDKDITRIKSYHCDKCAETRGPTTYHPPPRESGRRREKIDYAALNMGDTSAAHTHQHAHTPYLTRTFAPDHFPRLHGHELTSEYAHATGLKTPAVVPAEWNKGLNMKVPKLTVRQVAESVGEDVAVEVMDVPTQSSSPGWTLGSWADYYETPAAERDRVRNVISLEVSQSELAKDIVRPKFVRDLDWVDMVWPASAGPVPEVQLYCLMSVSNAFTDFHVDFAASSVWYHVVQGTKTFLFVPPTPANLRKYELWCLSSDQKKTWYPDTLTSSGSTQCVKVELRQGDTMCIPSGWIHAVYTPTDSLVIGGNFLTPINIPTQLELARIEVRTKVPKKFRFPKFQEVLWFAVEYYLREKPALEGKGYERLGVGVLAEYLWVRARKAKGFMEVSEKDQKGIRESIPGRIRDKAEGLARELGLWVHSLAPDEPLPEWSTIEDVVAPTKKRKSETKSQDKKRVKKDDTKSESEEQETWMFDCPACGVQGENLDDGSAMIMCERCQCWMHVDCLPKEKVPAGEGDEFVCSRCGEE